MVCNIIRKYNRRISQVKWISWSLLPFWSYIVITIIKNIRTYQIFWNKLRWIWRNSNYFFILIRYSGRLCMASTRNFSSRNCPWDITTDCVPISISSSGLRWRGWRCRSYRSWDRAFKGIVIRYTISNKKRFWQIYIQNLIRIIGYNESCFSAISPEIITDSTGIIDILILTKCIFFCKSLDTLQIS